jgi:hypothetical protein
VNFLTGKGERKKYLGVVVKWTGMRDLP